MLSRCLAVLVWAVPLLAVFCSGSRSVADEGRGTDVPRFTSFLAQYCVRCHDEDRSEGDLDLQNLEFDFQDAVSAQKWLEVLDRINLGEMPPQDERRPTVEELDRVVTWLTARIRQAQSAVTRTGRKVVMRRMTRLEYARTVSDLFSLEFVEGKGPLSQLPPDGAIQGFDRHSRALMIDPSLMDGYLAVAQQIAGQAIQFEAPLVPEKTMRFDFRDTEESAMAYLLDSRRATLEDDMMVVMEGNARTFSMMRHPFCNCEVPETGRYRIKIRAGAVPGKTGAPVFMRVKQGVDESIAQFRVDADPKTMGIYEAVVTRSDSLQGEFEVGIVGGTKFKRYVPFRGEALKRADEAFRAGDLLSSIRQKARMRAQGDLDVGARDRYVREVQSLKEVPKLYLDYIEVTGPLRDAFPPKSMRLLFPNGWSVVHSDTEKRGDRKASLQLARLAFATILPRAYRRPVTNEEREELVGLVSNEMDYGESFEAAMKTGVVAMLCSPHFLFLHEANRQVADDGRVYSETDRRTLTPFELATRMSYFLWSSKPDDALMRSAASGALTTEKGLREQIERMVDSPRIEGFIQGFVRQWLKTDGFNRFPPDERVFPRFHEARFAGIEDDFQRQPLAMVRELLKRDASLTDLIDSDWSMLNERLADYYGISGVTGNQMQRVSLLGRDAAIRGGLLGMAGIHRWGSDGSRTKPVERGKYLLDVFFNDPPPPPPPNAGEVEPNLHGQKLSVRDRLKKHREQATCFNCHRKIDPYGLALENFNTIGLWREREDGEKPIEHWGESRPVIDSSGVLMNGTQFNDFVEFKDVMLQQRERFVRGLVEKLLSYSLARSVEPGDRMLIDAIVARSQASNYSLKTILASIIQSKTFRVK